MMDEVTLCVPTFNSSSTVGDTLAAVKDLDPSPFEVFVVDGGSSDGTLEIVRSYNIYIINQGDAPGLSGARNVALDRCETEYLAMIDSDVVPASDWLGVVVSELQKHSCAATTAGIRHITPTLSARWAADRMDLSPTSEPGPTDIIPGANGCYRVDSLNDVGGWDESYPFANEDLAISDRLQKAGYELRYTEDTYVEHRSPQGLNAVYQLWRWHRPEGKPNTVGEVIKRAVENTGKSVLYSIEHIKDGYWSFVLLDLSIVPLHAYWDVT